MSGRAGRFVTAGPGTTGAGDVAVWKALAGAAPFPVEAPDYLPSGYAYSAGLPESERQYFIKAKGGDEPALRVIYQRLDQDQYLGVTETSWLDAPIAARGKQVQQNGITCTVVGTQGKVDHVRWRKGGVLCWVSNTITYLLLERELLKTAELFVTVSKP